MIKNNYPWKNKLSDDECCESIPIINVKDLNLSYGKHKAFEDISLNINRGCVTGIIGPSGCGKSSFVHCLNRMIELYPNSNVDGDIYFNGKSIFDSRVSLMDLRKSIGVVFQEPTPLPLSVVTNIELPLKEHRFDNVKERAIQALKDVGLWEEVKDKLHTPANNLSGGQKQRLCIARTIALEPEVILMDEPCSSLDPISTEKIESLIHNLKGRYTILIVTHNLAQARRICDYVYAFWYDEFEGSGKILESGTCSDVFEHSKNQIIRDYVGGLKG
ncbi:phosphate ABC transporter ATP-binding protein [Halobacteriovorax sp.]|uniref:phosphate ABC transporter ATP-binding protein n=1 Tax=Halobacteriovorax sp. TaxID=2020862 RepID=UPI003AF1E7C0